MTRSGLWSPTQMDGEGCRELWSCRGPCLDRTELRGVPVAPTGVRGPEPGPGRKEEGD